MKKQTTAIAMVQVPGMIAMFVFAMFLGAFMVLNGCATTKNTVTSDREPVAISSLKVEAVDSDVSRCMFETHGQAANCVFYMSFYEKGDLLNAAHTAAQYNLGGKYVEWALEPLFRKHFEAEEFAEAVGIMNQFGIAGYRAGDRVFWNMAEWACCRIPLILTSNCFKLDIIEIGI